MPDWASAAASDEEHVGQTIAVRGLPITAYRPAQPTQATENDRLRHQG
jgi:hypothetical protein